MKCTFSFVMAAVEKGQERAMDYFIQDEREYRDDGQQLLCLSRREERSGITMTATAHTA
jgi:hypothetical protein